MIGAVMTLIFALLSSYLVYSPLHKDEKKTTISIFCFFIGVMMLISGAIYQHYQFKDEMKSPPKECILRLYYIDGGIEDKSYTYHAKIDINQYTNRGSYYLIINKDKERVYEIGVVRYKIIK
jgi:hypothetical protein